MQTTAPPIKSGAAAFLRALGVAVASESMARRSGLFASEDTAEA